MASVQETQSSSSLDEAQFSEGVAAFREAVKPLASLKLSVFLFACGIFLVLAGTLAQVEKDIWDVVAGYFRCWIAWIDFQVFFPKTWVPQMQNIPGGFWFPGGWMIGGLMALNLLTAHALRFKVQAKGSRMIWGLVVTGLGVILTWAMIEFGTAREAVYETAGLDFSTYWNLLCYGLLVPAIGCGVAASYQANDKSKRAEFYTYSVIGLILLGTSLFLIAGGESVRLNNSAMRILWQLIQATVAGGVLLGGCLLLFKKRAGIVLLHAGVLLLMANEVVVYSLHDEANMVIAEGETTNFVRDIRSSELAVIDHSDPKEDQQTVVPDKLLVKNAGTETPISSEQLPFDIKVREFVKNADLKPRTKEDVNPADFGFGLTHTIEPMKPSSGMDSSADYAGAYIDLIDKKSGEKIHTLLVSALASQVDRRDTVKIGDNEYEVALRFKRNYKPYSIHLIDVRKDDYIGTSTPMNYSSEIRLVDKTRNEDRHIKIWMNNPLRFAGETFYQSGYQKLGDKEVTTLQVVTNEGWMIPYVACMIVAIGMLYQFALTLLRFLNRYASGRLSGMNESGEEDEHLGSTGYVTNYVPAVVLMVLCGYWLVSLSKVPDSAADEFNYYEFGKIPVVYDGRIKPIDTLARNTLRILSSRETIRTEPEYADGEEKSEGESKEAETILGTQWLLELASGSQKAFERPVIRIDNDEILSTLELDRRKSHRFSLEEIQPNIQELAKAAGEARELKEKSPESLSIYQRKLLDLEGKIGRVDLVTRSFVSPSFDLSSDKVTEQFMFALSEAKQLDARQPPLLIPPVPEAMGPDEANLKRDQWETYSKAFLRDIIYPGAFKSEPNPFSGKFAEIILAYQDQDPQAFNQAVRDYQKLLKEYKIEKVSVPKLANEARFNNFSPFFYPGFLYIFAFVVTAISWMLPQIDRPANRAAMGLIFLTFAVHSWAIWMRIQISGRPPVTNLYSSAVFIGWAGVLFGLICEWLFKRGIGNVVAAVAGFASLWIAHGLAGDGDTFTVLQAVLDTQFWLSTHVVCITLGYSATFIAGLLGMYYVCRRNPLAIITLIAAAGCAVGLREYDSIPLVLRNLGPFLLAIPLSIIPLTLLTGAPQLKLPTSIEKQLPRMIYGTLCFALWFSFVGTVLGGLWADDSWGRFWGWDPKENGALIIVLWNALVLHARWDRIVGDRGLALLAIAGNITTAWSWFGVNELGVGLHSYGFTEGVLFNLALFVFSQLTLIVIGLWGSPPKSVNP